MSDPIDVPAACSLQPPADYEPDAATALAILNRTPAPIRGEDDQEDDAERAQSIMRGFAGLRETERETRAARDSRTTIYGPWVTQEARDRVFAGMTAERRARSRKARFGGRFWIEVWPTGTALGAAGVRRAWPPRVPALPPIVFLPTPNKSARRSAVSGLVVHETEGGYLGAVSWLRQERANASAHLVLREDGGHCTQLVPFGDRAWHAANANDWTVGLELSGFTAASNDPAQLAAAARIIALVCHRFDIPVRRGGDDGRGGITTHRQLGTFGGGHHDPGGFSVDALIGAAARELSRGGFPAWGV